MERPLKLKTTLSSLAAFEISSSLRIGLNCSNWFARSSLIKFAPCLVSQPQDSEGRSGRHGSLRPLRLAPQRDRLGAAIQQVSGPRLVRRCVFVLQQIGKATFFGIGRDFGPSGAHDDLTCPPIQHERKPLPWNTDLPAARDQQGGGEDHGGNHDGDRCAHG